MGDLVISRAKETAKTGEGYNVFEGRKNPARLGIMDRVKEFFRDKSEITETFVKTPDGKIVPAKAKINNSAVGQLVNGGQSNILSLEIDGEEVDYKEYIKAAEGDVEYATQEDLWNALDKGELSEEMMDRVLPYLKKR